MKLGDIKKNDIKVVVSDWHKESVFDFPFKFGLSNYYIFSRFRRTVTVGQNFSL